MRRVQAFSTSVPRKADVSKVILVGRLGREPEVKTTKSDKEYVSLVSSLPLHQYTNNLPTPVTFTDTLLLLPTFPLLLRVLTAVSANFIVYYSEDRPPRQHVPTLVSHGIVSSLSTTEPIITSAIFCAVPVFTLKQILKSASLTGTPNLGLQVPHARSSFAMVCQQLPSWWVSL